MAKQKTVIAILFAAILIVVAVTGITVVTLAILPRNPVAATFGDRLSEPAGFQSAQDSPPSPRAFPAITNLQLSAVDTSIPLSSGWEEYFQGDPTREQIEDLLSTLGDRQLMFLLAFLCESDNLSMILSAALPEMKRRWGKNVPFSALCELAADPSNNARLRDIASDIVCCSAESASTAEISIICDSLFPIVLDTKEESRFRELLIKRLSVVLSRREIDSLNYESALLAVLKSESQPPIVRGATATALRRMNSQHVYPYLVNICGAYDGNASDSPLIRYAVVEGAKVHMRSPQQDISPTPSLQNVLSVGTDDPLIASTIYASTLLAANDFIGLLPDLLNARDRINTTYVDLSFERAVQLHEDAVLAATQSTDEQLADAAIRSLQVIKNNGINND